jgi:hypothetical protein
MRQLNSLQSLATTHNDMAANWRKRNYMAMPTYLKEMEMECDGEQHDGE